MHALGGSRRSRWLPAATALLALALGTIALSGCGVESAAGASPVGHDDRRAVAMVVSIETYALWVNGHGWTRARDPRIVEAVYTLDGRQTLQVDSASALLETWEPNAEVRRSMIAEWDATLHDMAALDALRDSWGTAFDSTFLVVQRDHLLRSRAALQAMLEDGDLIASTDLVTHTIDMLDDDLVLLAQVDGSFANSV